MKRCSGRFSLTSGALEIGPVSQVCCLFVFCHLVISFGVLAGFFLTGL